MQPATSPSKPSAEEQIRSAPCPICLLCGSGGEVLHHGQRDRLFGAGGLWDAKKCSNPQCGLVWLDPMPLAEDIGKAYASYYTHASPNDAKQAGLLKRIYLQMERGYWAAKYNYLNGPGSFAVKTLGKLLYLFPIRRNTMDAEARHLHAVPNGRLLDVGCGSGDWLLTMRGFGWQVQGMDFDENAVKAARQNGLDVGCGSLEQQEYPDNSFDAVTLNHVIEHVPDPVGTLAECARILKPGGKLVVLTPNSSSLGHSVFKQNWRGLEPPRHLHIFSNRSMRLLLARAGFKQISIHPQIARSVIHESILLRRGAGGPKPRPNWSSRLLTRLFNMRELMLLKFNPDVADCVGAVAVKE
jgi:SAM-dependent methyltransferase